MDATFSREEEQEEENPFQHRMLKTAEVVFFHYNHKSEKRLTGCGFHVEQICAAKGRGF